MYELAKKKYLEEHGFEALRPKAVLFDMDGVLYDSMPNHAIAWQESMAQLGLQMTADDAYATEGARGIDTIRVMVRLQQKREIDEAEAQRMYDVKSRIFHRLPEAPIMPGIMELMGKIKAAGLQIGIVTGSGQRPLINRLTTDFAPFVCEEKIITAYDVQRGKPNPAPYLMGMERCATRPWETIVVENAPLGIQAGNAAKAFTFGVNTGPLPDDQLWEAGADCVLPSMNELCARWKVLL